MPNAHKVNRIGKPVPELPVVDVERAQRHYCDALGFRIGWIEPDGGIGAVLREEMTIFLRQRTPPFEPAVHWIFADDLDASHDELKSLGANIVSPPERKPWGLRQFPVQDLDGNIFYFHNDGPADKHAPSGVGAMPQRVVLTSTEAQLFVADLAASRSFYTGKLGFSVAFEYGDPPFYAQVRRDQARLNLRLVGDAVFAGDIREREELLAASLTVAETHEMDELFAEYEAAGVRFCQTLQTEPWGARTFVALDPDGNRILFAGPAEGSADPA